jgi:hypothetical protein
VVSKTSARAASAIVSATIRAISVTGLTRLGAAEVRTYPPRDTARAISQENVEVVERAVSAPAVKQSAQRVMSSSAECSTRSMALQRSHWESSPDRLL